MSREEEQNGKTRGLTVNQSWCCAGTDEEGGGRAHVCVRVCGGAEGTGKRDLNDGR